MKYDNRLSWQILWMQLNMVEETRQNDCIWLANAVIYTHLLLLVFDTFNWHVRF
jgi:hypothetical protein